MATRTKKSQTRQPAQAQNTKRGGGLTVPMLLLIVLILLMVVSLSTVVVIFFAMLPTLVAAVVDRTRGKLATFSVGGFNFAALFPFLLGLWRDGDSMAHAGDILLNVFNLLLFYGAAAFGWALFSIIPPVVVGILTVINDKRIAMLRAQQRRLIEEWGEGVTSNEETQSAK